VAYETFEFRDEVSTADRPKPRRVGIERQLLGYSAYVSCHD
jgi:hypothetical protein